MITLPLWLLILIGLLGFPVLVLLFYHFTFIIKLGLIVIKELFEDRKWKKKTKEKLLFHLL